MTSPPLRVSILGAGALGQAYAAACLWGGAAVTLVKRPTQPAPAVVAERLTFPRRRAALSVTWADELPDTDVVLVCVRAEQIDEPLLATLKRVSDCGGAVIFVTPLVPERAAAARSMLPQYYFVMPSLIAEFHSGDVRFWVAPIPTLICTEARTSAAVLRLSEVLRLGGVRTRFQRELSPYALASTIVFFPIQLALLREPAIGAWRAQPGLLAATAHALRLSCALARRLGTGDVGLFLLMWLLSWLPLLWFFSVVFPKVMPRLGAYLGHHFGEKLRAQHRLLYREYGALGAAHGVPQNYGPLLDPH